MPHAHLLLAGILVLFAVVSCNENSTVIPKPSSLTAPTPTPDPGTGSITGKITDAQSGSAINGATVYVVGSQAATQTTSNASGDYSISGATTGTAVVYATKTAYNSSTLNTTVVKDSTITGKNISLLTTAFAATKFAVILTWNTTPADLDSHLWISTPAYEVNYATRGDTDGTLDSAPFAGLDLDDVDGSGPETITIKKSGSNTNYAGLYRYWVHNYSAGNALPTSNAQVKVFNEGVLIQTYNVPTSGTGEYWHVFDLTGSTFSAGAGIMAAQPATP